MLPELTQSDRSATAEGCYFDEAKATKAIAWIESTFGIRLYQWQRDLACRYFGWRRADGGYRFNRISLWIPKKNGKSWFIAVLILYKLFELRNASIYSAAYNAMQAKIVMESAIKLCKQSASLSPLLKPRTGRLRAFCSPFRRDFTNEITGSKYTALADNVNANDGLIPDVLVIDEVHRMKNRQIDVVDGSTSNNPNALKVYMSTAGDGDKTHRSWQIYLYAKKVLTGAVIDTQMLAIIYECPNAAKLKGDEIYDLDLLVACNPVLQEDAAKRAQAAKEIEEAREKRNDAWWRRFRLNQWVAMDGDTYIDAALYEKCETHEPLDMDGRDCFFGFDRSGGVWDFHAGTLLFPLDDGRVFEKHFTFASADRLADMGERDDRDYTPLVGAGELVAIPAEAVADEWMYEFLRGELKKYNVRRIAADPYAAAYLLERWKVEGFDVVAVQQANNRMLSPVIEDYATRIGQRRIVHASNGLVAWQLSCARKISTAKDVCKIVKGGSSTTGKGGAGHIDNVDSLLNALAVLRAHEIERGSYQNASDAVIA